MGECVTLPELTHEDVASSRQTRFLARQPIFDKQRKTVAYELLFRSGWENFFNGDSDDSTRQMLDNVLIAGTESLSSNTLVGESNFTAFPLAVARSFETGDWNSLPESRELLSLGSDRVNRMCFEAIRWAEDALLPDD